MKKPIMLVALLGACFSANAAFIDFEDVANGTQVSTVYPSSVASVTSQGFVFENFNQFSRVEDNSDPVWGTVSGNGTRRLTSYNTSILRMTPADSGKFDLLSFEGGESWTDLPHVWATQIKVTGYSGASFFDQTFDLDIIKNNTSGLELFYFSNSFVNLDYVEFIGIGGNPEFTVDNIEVSTAAVPEPASLALMCLGLAGIGYSRHRSQQAV